MPTTRKAQNTTSITGGAQGTTRTQDGQLHVKGVSKSTFKSTSQRSLLQKITKSDIRMELKRARLEEELREWAQPGRIVLSNFSEPSGYGGSYSQGGFIGTIEGSFVSLQNKKFVENVEVKTNSGKKVTQRSNLIPLDNIEPNTWMEVSSLDETTRECFERQTSSSGSWGGWYSTAISFIINSEGKIGLIYQRLSDSKRPLTYNDFDTYEEAQQDLERRLEINV